MEIKNIIMFIGGFVTALAVVKTILLLRQSEMSKLYSQGWELHIDRDFAYNIFNIRYKFPVRASKDDWHNRTISDAQKIQKTLSLIGNGNLKKLLDNREPEPNHSQAGGWIE